MIVLVDVVIDEHSPEGLRPAPGWVAHVELRDVSLADEAAVTLAESDTLVAGTASSWLATTELVVDDGLDASSDLTVWVRAAEDLLEPLAGGDWITMQAVPVDPRRDEQRVRAAVRPVG